MFDTVLVAGRGLAARRVVRSCQRLSVQALTVHVEDDADALHAAESDESLLLGSGLGPEAYLDVDRLVEAARQGRAGAVHPGGTALARDPAAARAVLDAGLAWVGAPPEALARLAPLAVPVGRTVDVPVLLADEALVLAPRGPLVHQGRLRATVGLSGRQRAHDDEAVAPAVALGGRGLLTVAFGEQAPVVRPGLDLADPVTDALHGTDLVALALLAAAGDPLPEVAAPQGAALQVLVHASGPGVLGRLSLPDGAETPWREGDAVEAGALLAAVVLRVEDPAALPDRTRDLLDALVVEGVPTDLAEVRTLLEA